MTSSLIIWMAGLALGVGAMVLAAGAKMPGAHMAMAATIGILIAMLAVRENRALLAASASKTTLAEIDRSLHGSGMDVGRPRPSRHVCRRAPLARVVALLPGVRGCGRGLPRRGRDAGARRQGRSAGRGHAQGRTRAHDGAARRNGGHDAGPHHRRQDDALPRPRHGDWAANNIFFFGALALAAISLNALLASRSREA